VLWIPLFFPLLFWLGAHSSVGEMFFLGDFPTIEYEEAPRSPSLQFCFRIALPFSLFLLLRNYSFEKPSLSSFLFSSHFTNNFLCCVFSQCTAALSPNPPFPLVQTYKLSAPPGMGLLSPLLFPPAPYTFPLSPFPQHCLVTVDDISFFPPHFFRVFNEVNLLPIPSLLFQREVLRLEPSLFFSRNPFEARASVGRSSCFNFFFFPFFWPR